jgi:aspartyl-tRNA(Asn)/glutamyl-tRNA(Gln) amidotransferase subunit C
MSSAGLDLAYVAHLARLTLTPAEMAQLGPQLGSVLEYFAQLEEVDVTGLEPTAHPVPLVNVTRPDVVRPSLAPTEALRNAPALANDLFVVPKIVE